MPQGRPSRAASGGGSPAAGGYEIWRRRRASAPGSELKVLSLLEAGGLSYQDAA